MRQKLLRCISDLMNDPGINETHIATANDIFDFEADARTFDVQLLDEELSVLDDWITRNSNEKDDGGDNVRPPQGNRSLLEKVRQLENRVIHLRSSVFNTKS
jgi:hypothetical protein